MDKLSDRDKTKIREAIAEKLVDKICDALIEGKPLTSNLRETLGNTMTGVLNEPENKSKITQTIFQSVDSALKMPLQGPLLLFALVNNEQSYNYIQNYITMIFSKVYNKNDTIKLFNTRLYDQLSKPPYESWFSQISQQSQMRGGGTKRKTKRSTKYNKGKHKTKSIRKQRGGIKGALANMGKNFVKKNKGKIEKQAKKLAEEHKDDIAKMAQDASNTASQMGSGQTSEPASAPASAPASENTSIIPSFISGAKEKEKEMTGPEIEQNADELVEKFGSSLIEKITTDIPSISPQILQRMLNASYIHAIKNGDQLVDSAINTLARTITTTPLLRDIFPVILVQSLFNSGKYVMESIATSFQQQKKDAQDKGGNDDITFKPTDSNFVIIFMGKLKENISKQINME